MHARCRSLLRRAFASWTARAGEKQALRATTLACAQRLLFGSLARTFLSWQQHAQARPPSENLGAM